MYSHPKYVAISSSSSFVNLPTRSLLERLGCEVPILAANSVKLIPAIAQATLTFCCSVMIITSSNQKNSDSIYDYIRNRYEYQYTITEIIIL